jgi:Icc-related predicted phosphoesterase
MSLASLLVVAQTAQTPGTVRLAAIGDLHYSRSSTGAFQKIFNDIVAAADAVLLPGDLTDYGLADEARGLARELQGVRVPVVAVLGNHDFESGQEAEITSILREAGVIVLDGDTVEVHGVGIAGVKGFCGGFGRHTLGSWGEPSIKAFVQEGLNEALKLEAALARLRTPTKVALLHYAPVQDTVVGEPEPIYPFLGSSRLEEPINRLNPTIVVHGHAHRGQPEGRTTSGIPVYNVSFPLLNRLTPEQPFRMIVVPGSIGSQPLVS